MTTSGRQHGLPGQPVAGLHGAAVGEREEDRHRAERIHDHHERDEDLAEELAVEVVDVMGHCVRSPIVSAVIPASSRSNCARVGGLGAEALLLAGAVVIAAAGDHEIQLVGQPAQRVAGRRGA